MPAKKKEQPTQAQAAPPAQSIKSLFRDKKNTIAQALTDTPLTPERLLSVVMTEIRRTPKLQECSHVSILGSVVQAAQLGLEPGNVLGYCYLIPFWDGKTRQLECQFMLGYRGMLALARRSGDITNIEARTVYENDDFHIQYGTEAHIRHVPALGADRGQLMGFYGVSHLAGGGYHIEWLPRDKIEAIRKRSKAGESGPWQTDYEEMGRKTVIRRMFKYLPVSIEAQKAAHMDEQVELGESQNNGVVIQGDEESVVIDENTGEILGDVRNASDLNNVL
ncbi:recombination protein RecT [Sansalvadorimonas verongulae]|uniref:recombination protein RecT n=1 Tax=Sansalvadorimonas verongulae TaxID=2172824 RepID=UPI0012BD7CF2|nr:recombination protein RecT [Sansalvadorimonas verongulae]MTI12396.1 recombination protein RecT [Sansalvadorimonas verongulae]